jgi:hypothetical protein
MTGLASYDSMSCFNHRQAGRADRGQQLLSIAQGVEHLAFDLDVVLGQAETVELGDKLRNPFIFRRCRHSCPRVPPTTKPRIFEACPAAS